MPVRNNRINRTGTPIKYYNKTEKPELLTHMVKHINYNTFLVFFLFSLFILFSDWILIDVNSYLRVVWIKCLILLLGSFEQKYRLHIKSLASLNQSVVFWNKILIFARSNGFIVLLTICFRIGIDKTRNDEEITNCWNGKINKTHD